MYLNLSNRDMGPVAIDWICCGFNVQLQRALDFFITKMISLEMTAVTCHRYPPRCSSLTLMQGKVISKEGYDSFSSRM